MPEPTVPYFSTLVLYDSTVKVEGRITEAGTYCSTVMLYTIVQ